MYSAYKSNKQGDNIHPGQDGHHQKQFTNNKCLTGVEKKEPSCTVVGSLMAQMVKNLPAVHKTQV